jgi:hypothetical protein
MIKPTVGRVVWFRILPEAREQAAVVCYVHDDRMVNLVVFDMNGVPYSACSVKLLQDDDEAPKYQHCLWMPYQKGQAAKTEALEAQLKT